MRRPRFSRGSVLVVVLFVMTVLSLGAVSLSYRASLYSRSIRNRTIMLQLKSHASSAVSIAMARIIENASEPNDRSDEQTNEEKSVFDHRAEPWCSHAPLASESWLPEWQEDKKGRSPVFVTDYQVIDEEGKLNLANASSEALEKLGMSSEQIASFFDWVDKDDIARPEGAEEDHYLARQFPYRCKNGKVGTLNELLMVKGFQVRDLIGEDLNRNHMLDASEDDGNNTYPPDNADGVLQLGLVDLVTCVGGRININTAPEEVLNTLPLSDGAVSQIVRFREYDEGSLGDLEDHVFRSQEDIDQLQGLTNLDKELLGSVGTFTSQHFRILAQSSHGPTGLRHQLEVLVKVDSNNLEILQWKAGS